MDDYRMARKRIFRRHAMVLAVAVFILSLIAWWKQGLTTALIGGLSLFAFLFLVMLAEHYFEGRKHGRR